MTFSKELGKLFTPSFTFIVFIFYIILLYILYKYKKTYQFLFNNPLGYILILFVIGISYYFNKWFGIFIGFALGLLYILSRSINFFLQLQLQNKSKNIEGFDNQGLGTEGFDISFNSSSTSTFVPWSQTTIDNFEDWQNTKNPNLIFDLSNIQQQATEDEAKQLIENGKWTWDKDTKKLFIENVQSNTMIKTSPEDALNKARTIYNQTVIKQMLSWKAKEGQFLLTGIFVDSSMNHAGDSNGNTYGVLSGLVSPNHNLIKCGKNTDGEMVMQMTQNMGNDGITGAHNEKVTDVDYNDLPNMISGFSFINSPCNPCLALDNPPDYTCPFSLSDGKNGISSIWKNLWGLDESEPSSVEEGYSMDKKNSKEFPLLYKLKSELNSVLPNTNSKETTSSSSKSNSNYQPYSKNQF